MLHVFSMSPTDGANHYHIYYIQFRIELLEFTPNFMANFN